RIDDAEADPAALARRLLGDPGAQSPTRSVGISARTGAGMDKLLAAIDEVLPLDPIVRTTLRLPSGDGASLAMLHEFGRVLSTRYLEDEALVEVEAEVPESLKRRLDAPDD